MAPRRSPHLAAVHLLVLCSCACAAVVCAAADNKPSLPAAASAESIVQRQLDAFNARDVEAYMALLADDCSVITDTGEVLAQGTEQLRRRYTEKFRSPALRSVLHGRLALGDTVVDRETVYGLPGGASDALGTYTVKDGKIARMVFKFQPVEQQAE